MRQGVDVGIYCACLRNNYCRIADVTSLQVDGMSLKDKSLSC